MTPQGSKLAGAVSSAVPSLDRFVGSVRVAVPVSVPPAPAPGRVSVTLSDDEIRAMGYFDVVGPASSESSASSMAAAVRSAEWLTKQEVAKRFGVSDRTVVRWSEGKGGFPRPHYPKAGARPRWSRREIEAWESRESRRA